METPYSVKAKYWRGETEYVVEGPDVSVSFGGKDGKSDADAVVDALNSAYNAGMLAQQRFAKERASHDRY